jgi:hypothetical protein
VTLNHSVLEVLTFLAANTYLKSSLPLLRADAQFTVVESALRGYIKWRQAHGADLEQQVLLGV